MHGVKYPYIFFFFFQQTFYMDKRLEFTKQIKTKIFRDKKSLISEEKKIA